MSKCDVKTFTLGNRTVRMETGRIARQATAAVLIDVEGTTLLATVVCAKAAVPGASFFPLTVVYQGRAYAGGKIPGGYFKREGRPTEIEILISRLIDRSLRPLFPEGFYHEVQIVITALSINPEVCPDIPALLGASCALALSGIPFAGPVGALQVGYINGQYVVNPSPKELEQSDLELIVAGTKTSVLMVESEASQLSEEVMLGAVTFGFNNWQVAITAIEEFAASCKEKDWAFTPKVVDKALVAEIDTFCRQTLINAYLMQEKMERQDAIKALKAQAEALFLAIEEPKLSKQELLTLIDSIEANIVRENILAGKPRIDGRDNFTVRPIRTEIGVLPRTHGSALFTRGETQALVVATLGTSRDAQIIEGHIGEVKESFMLHYNFPPYCVGETGQMGSPKRREIGHGKLAKRGIQSVLPEPADFPYVIRVVSEITESNGSSSMASVCGTSLALMDAGVPITAPVAGAAMGLIKEGNRIAVITDILGDEDHLGDMDFKVAGTSEGITALQMDIKIQGITTDIMKTALAQAKEARMHILQEMAKTITIARSAVSQYAPKMLEFKIHTDKIREVIGKGGATIRAITEQFEVVIEITDDGMVTISAPNGDKAQAAKEHIEMLLADLEIDKVYKGTVVRIVEFGAFVNLMPGKDGLLHISKISRERVENVEDYLEMGQIVEVRVLDIDRQGKVKLSMVDV